MKCFSINSETLLFIFKSTIFALFSIDLISINLRIFCAKDSFVNLIDHFILLSLNL